MFKFLLSSGDFIKISTKDIIFYFLIAILIISTIVILAIFSNKPKNIKKIKTQKKREYEATQVMLMDNELYYSKNYKRVQKQIEEDLNG